MDLVRHRRSTFPCESLTYLKTEPGLKVELVVSEPMVVSPVAMAWDENGRMYVVEDRGYPVGPARPAPAGQVVLLEDTGRRWQIRQSGRCSRMASLSERSHALERRRVRPCAPLSLLLKDTNGDGKADQEIVFKGFQDLSTTATPRQFIQLSHR